MSVHICYHSSSRESFHSAVQIASFWGAVKPQRFQASAETEFKELFQTCGSLVSRCFHATEQISLEQEKKGSPECRFDTPDVILSPIPSCNLLLADGHSLPDYTHDSHSISFILIKMYLKPTIVFWDPLAQTPLLNYFHRFLELDKFTANVAIEELEFTANMCTFEYFWGGAGERCETVGGSKGLIQLGCCCTKFFSSVYCSCV